MTEWPLWIAISFFVPLLMALGLQFLGASLPRVVAWLAGAAIFSEWVGLGLAWTDHLERGLQRDVWSHSWILGVSDDSTIGLGFLRDTLGLSMASWVVLLCSLLLLNVELTRSQRKPHWVFSGIILGSVGLLMSWFGATPWTTWIGVGLTILSSLFALGSDWESEFNATFAMRSVRERSIGLGSGILGTLMVNASGASLSWVDTPLAPAVPWLGGLLVLLGAFLQFQPIPFLAGAVLPTRHLSLNRVLLAQVFPSLAAVVIVIRLESILRAAEILPHFGWIALISMVLAGWTGLINSNWQSSLSSWSTALFSAVICSLAFSGPWSALSVLFGAITALTVFSVCGSLLELPQAEKRKAPVQLRSWLVPMGFWAVAVGAGFWGSAGAGGPIRTIMGAAQDPTNSWGPLAGAAVSIGFMMVVVLGLKLVWFANRLLVKPLQVSWINVLTPSVLLLLGMGWLSTGTVSGGAIFGEPDRIGFSLLDAVVGTAQPALDPNEFAFASLLRWGGWLIGLALAIWTSRGTPSAWERFEKKVPRFSNFISSGYVLEKVSLKSSALFLGLGTWMEGVTGAKVWDRWIPATLGRMIQLIGRAIEWVDLKVLRALEQSLQSVVEIPARGLQRIQSGDAQWYLFLAVGSALAVLLHYLIRGNA